MAHKAKAKSSKKTKESPDRLKTGADAAPVTRIIVSNLPRDADGKVIRPTQEADTKAEANPRQAVLTAFGRVGGVRWLVRYAKRDPKGFAGLLAKAMPSEVNVTGHLGYTATPIPVEVREPIPGEFTVVSEIVAPLVTELDPFT